MSVSVLFFLLHGKEGYALRALPSYQLSVNLFGASLTLKKFYNISTYDNTVTRSISIFLSACEFRDSTENYCVGGVSMENEPLSIIYNTWSNFDWRTINTPSSARLITYLKQKT